MRKLFVGCCFTRHLRRAGNRHLFHTKKTCGQRADPGLLSATVVLIVSRHPGGAEKRHPSHTKKTCGQGADSGPPGATMDCCCCLVVMLFPFSFRCSIISEFSQKILRRKSIHFGTLYFRLKTPPPQVDPLWHSLSRPEFSKNTSPQVCPL